MLDVAHFLRSCLSPSFTSASQSFPPHLRYLSCTFSQPPCRVLLCIYGWWLVLTFFFVAFSIMYLRRKVCLNELSFVYSDYVVCCHFIDHLLIDCVSCAVIGGVVLKRFCFKVFLCYYLSAFGSVVLVFVAVRAFSQGLSSSFSRPVASCCGAQALDAQACR